VQTQPCRGFEQTLSEEERWDLINFMRALATGDRARSPGACDRERALVSGAGLRVRDPMAAKPKRCATIVSARLSCWSCST
jgi:hypothetical protein